MTTTVIAILAVIATEPVAAACPARVEGERLKKPAFKGVELYSWKQKGEPRFALLWGTNRNKTEGEIKRKDCVLSDVRAVKVALGHLAEGEHVFWANATCPRNACEYPPGEVLQALYSHAREVGVTLEATPSAEER